MLIFELLVVIVLLAFIAHGMRIGAIETLGRVVGSIIGFLVGRAYAGWLIGLISLVLPVDWAFTVSFLLIFLVVDHTIGLLFKLAEQLLKIFTKMPILKQISSILGAIFGFLEGIIVIGGVSWLIRQSAAEIGTVIITNLNSIRFIDTVFQKLFLSLM